MTTAPDGCDACRARWPDPADFVADLGATTAHLHADQFFPGWTVLVLKRHATELFQLEPDERARLIEEVSLTAAAVHAAFGALKVNYALLGNLLPHVHWHVIPRLATDPAPRRSVWEVSHEPVSSTPADRAERIARLRAHLVRSRAPRRAPGSAS
jgi:diadenosine tetraphosphate (Ap4A) HIT family hydrolase